MFEEIIKNFDITEKKSMMTLKAKQCEEFVLHKSMKYRMKTFNLHIIQTVKIEIIRLISSTLMFVMLGFARIFNAKCK